MLSILGGNFVIHYKADCSRINEDVEDSPLDCDGYKWSGDPGFATEKRSVQCCVHFSVL